MTNIPASLTSRATTIAVCSGKGGVGKSTIAFLLASRLAEAGRRTVLIDADFGIGDIATMANLTPLVGFEQILIGVASVEAALLPVGPRLAIIGTLPGSDFEPALLTAEGLKSCRAIDDGYDTIVFDTPSTLDAFNLQLIGCADLAISVTTSRIPSIADSYVQLKRIAQFGKKTARCFIVNQTESETEGDQTITKFGELVDRFLGCSISALGVVEYDQRIEKAAESQSLLELTRQPGGFGRKAEKTVKVLLEKHLNQLRSGCSIWEQLESHNSLKPEISFDDNKVLIRA